MTLIDSRGNILCTMDYYWSCRRIKRVVFLNRKPCEHFLCFECLDLDSNFALHCASLIAACDIVTNCYKWFAKLFALLLLLLLLLCKWETDPAITKMMMISLPKMTEPLPWTNHPSTTYSILCLLLCDYHFITITTSSLSFSLLTIKYSKSWSSDDANCKRLPSLGQLHQSCLSQYDQT